MYWHDIKTESPNDEQLCLLEYEHVDGEEVHYGIAKFRPIHDPAHPWELQKGWYSSGETISKWMPILGVDQEESPYRTPYTSEWQDHLCIEYSQLNKRIDEVEKQLNFKEFTEDALKLLFEQRSYMLKYKDVLFRRICDFGIELYKEDE